MSFRWVWSPILLWAICSPQADATYLRRDLWLFGSNTVAPRTIGETCSDRQPCEEGLSCTESPSCFAPIAPRKVCFPTECLAKAVKDLDDQVNLTDYKNFIFIKASVTEEEFFMVNDMKRSRGPFDAYATVQKMMVSPQVHAVMKTIKENPITETSWNRYETALSGCDPENKLSQKTRFGYGPTTPGVLGAVGFGLDVGAGLGAGIEFFFAFPPGEGDPFFFIDIGGGLLFGIDGGGSVFAGAVFTGEASDIPGWGAELSLQIPTPIVGPGVSLGYSFEGVWDFSLTVNVGAGIGIGGLAVGYTFGFPFSDNATLVN